MNSIAISGITFACVFGGALFGLFLRTRLREHHLATETKDVVKMGVGLIATMTALVLGLLVASAKSSFDTQKSELAQISANVVMLDRALAHYGPEATGIREMLRGVVEHLIDLFWPTEHSPQAQPYTASEMVYEKLQGLSPKNESQRSLQAQGLKIAVDIAQTRWLLFAQKSSAISPPFLTVVVFWLTITFISFGLYASRNLVVFVTLFVCSLSVAGALFLVTELDRPFEGLIQISSEPMRNALGQLGR